MLPSLCLTSRQVNTEKTTQGHHMTHDMIEGEEQYEVEAIQAHQYHWCKLQYLIKWKGYPESDNMWKPINNMQAPLLIRKHHKVHPLKDTSETSEGSIIPHLQYWTSKGNKFYSIQNRFFRGNWVPGSFSGRLKMSKAWFWMLLTSLRVILAPNCPQKIYFGCYKICCLCLSSTVHPSANLAH
jgi:hypothetical protein